MSEDSFEDQLQAILKECNITPEDLKRPFPLKDAVVIAKDFSEWRLTNGHLNITLDEVRAIEENNKNDEELMRKSYMEKWIRKNGEKANYGMLLEALKLISRMDLVEKTIFLLSKQIKKDAPDDGLASDSGGEVKEEDMRFLCGCGECSLSSFLKNGCPNPWENSRFPLLNVKKLSKRLRLELLARLDKDAEQISLDFSSLMVDVYRCLKDIDVKELVLYLMPQQKFLYMDENDRKELFSKLKTAKDAGEVLTLLAESYMSWFNHPLLGTIAKKFNACKADYDKYVNEVFNPYIKRCLFEVPSSIDERPVGSGKFVLKVTTSHHLEHKDKTKAEILLPLRRHVSEACGISIDSFDICSYNKGCLRVEVAVPLALLEEIFPLPTEVCSMLSSFAYEGARIKSVLFREHHHAISEKKFPDSTPISIGDTSFRDCGHVFAIPGKKLPDSTFMSTTVLTDIINSFASLIVELYKSIKNKFSEAKLYLQTSIYVFQNRAHPGQLFEGIESEIKNAETAADLTIALNSFWSFFNYFLLYKMIRKFCSSDVITTTLSKYVNFIEEVPPGQYPPLIQPFTKGECFHTDLLILKLRESTINGDILYQIHRSVARWLVIESHALLLKRIKKGTNELEFLIPKCLAVTSDMPFPPQLLELPVLSISFQEQVIECSEKRSKIESEVESGFHSGSTEDESSSYMAESESDNSGMHIHHQSKSLWVRKMKVKPPVPVQSTEHFLAFQYNPNAPPFIPQAGPIYGDLLPAFDFYQRPSAQLHNVTNEVLESLQNEEAASELHSHTRLKTFQELENWKISFQSRLENTTLQETEVEAELTVANYRNKFYYLLCYEESAHIRLLNEKCNGEYNFILMEKKSGVYVASIKGMDGNRIQYATQASEAVFILDCETREEICKADVLPINYHSINDELLLQLSSSAMATFKQRIGKDSCKIYAEFEVKHNYFDTLHKAVVDIPHSMILKVVPSQESTPKSLSMKCKAKPRHKKHLNLDDTGQMQALDLILNSSSSVPVIVTGPFGSGKTKLLGHAAYEFVNDGLAFKKPTRVLICAHHYYTIETITKILAQELQMKPGVTVVKIVPNDFKRESSNIVYCNISNFTTDVKRGRYFHDQILVVITTYTMSLQVASVLSSNYCPFRFTHILLDEAAQVREPECIAALALGDKTTKVVLAGDSKQDGPSVVVLGDIARENGLKMSLLERLERQYDEIGGTLPLIHLDVNYRCHPMLTQFLAEVVYKYPIKSAANCSTRTACPCLFHCCHINSDVPSNAIAMEIEAKAVISWLEKLESEAKIPKDKIFEDNICVVSSFRKQLNIIQKEMKGKFEHVSLKPTYTIQGHEYNIVIISTYEPLEVDGRCSDSTKTLVNPGIFNTVVSRSKQCVIAVGNPFRLLDAEERMGVTSKCWKEYIKFCIDNNTMNYSPGLEVEAKFLKAKVGIDPSHQLGRSHSVDCKPSSLPFERTLSDSTGTGTKKVKSSEKGSKSTLGVPDTISKQSKPTKTSLGTSKHKKDKESPMKMSISSEEAKKIKSTLKPEQKHPLKKGYSEHETDIRNPKHEDVQHSPMTDMRFVDQSKLTAYRKPDLVDSFFASGGKQRKKKKQKKNSKATIDFDPFFHEPLVIETEPDSKSVMANTSSNFVKPGLSYADASKPKKAFTN
ncbi:PREDICTED: uncharacterized protein LOC109580354 isoform X2 [Amphimedon queenslandica]|uniref:Death domain-containing protein n=1 Tax=Amphimedon queenslandica TaxID=400682 RepID=A0A1X7VGW5_AMPQE|nr:PREDICTED: uncharacterized protein LOC109580354 isoform X2 [Amphimedon queenslandica]|eukprot:XP_019848953.1 PREDICTED: uncharacterized protein LOC109580354 isoform X2 [Amphimedon queenslandica]